MIVIPFLFDLLSTNYVFQNFANKYFITAIADFTINFCFIVAGDEKCCGFNKGFNYLEYLSSKNESVSITQADSVLLKRI